MSGAKGKSNYAYVGICRPFFNNKTSFVSIPLNIVLYVVLSRLFAKRPEYWGMFRHPASEIKMDLHEKTQGACRKLPFEISDSQYGAIRKVFCKSAV